MFAVKGGFRGFRSITAYLHLPLVYFPYLCFAIYFVLCYHLSKIQIQYSSSSRVLHYIEKFFMLGYGTCGANFGTSIEHGHNIVVHQPSLHSHLAILLNQN